MEQYKKEFIEFMVEESIMQRRSTTSTGMTSTYCSDRRTRESR